MSSWPKIAALLVAASICGGGMIWHGGYFEQECEPSAAADRAVYEVVLSQLKAFRADDFPGAYRHASTNFQGKWKVDDFATMIRLQYSTMLEPVRVEFGAVQYHGRRATAEVYLVGKRGRVIPCVYSFVREADEWRIDGAEVLPASRPDVVARSLQI